MPTEEEKRARDLISTPVPPGGTQQWEDWKQAASRISADCAPILVNALAEGSEEEQYSALIALREIGWEAWGDGYGKELTYRIKAPQETEWQVISPKKPPQDDPSGHATGVK